MYHRQIQIKTTVPDSINRAPSRRRYLAGLRWCSSPLGSCQRRRPCHRHRPAGAIPVSTLLWDTNPSRSTPPASLIPPLVLTRSMPTRPVITTPRLVLIRLLFNTTGNCNMGIGGGCLRNNIVGNNNTAIGFQAMSANTASGNSAIGYQALFQNTTGTDNNALGFQALFNNTTGTFNNAHGRAGALQQHRQPK